MFWSIQEQTLFYFCWFSMFSKIHCLPCGVFLCFLRSLTSIVCAISALCLLVHYDVFNWLSKLELNVLHCCFFLISLPTLLLVLVVVRAELHRLTCVSYGYPCSVREFFYLHCGVFGLSMLYCLLVCSLSRLPCLPCVFLHTLCFLVADRVL